MAVIFSPLVTITPVVGVETPVATIAGGPFDKVDAFIRGGGGGSGFLLFRLYATVGGLTSIVSQAMYQGDPAAPSRGALLMWTLPSNSGVTPPSDPVRQANDPTTDFSVRAGGTTYVLTVQPMASTRKITTATPPPVFPLLPFSATLAGVNDFDVAPDNNTSVAVTLPPTNAEVNAGLAAGYAQSADVAANMNGIPNLLFTLYASCGVGSVEAKVYTIQVSGGGGIKNIFRDITLPVATSYRLTVRKVNANGALGPAVTVSFATYSVMATAGGAIVLGGDVTGPSAANTVIKWDNVPLDLATMGAPAATSVPEFIGGTWHAVPIATIIGALVLGPDVTGTITTNKVVQWAHVPLDLVTMGAPVVGSVPTFNGAAWVAAPAGAVVLAGDVIGPSGANRVIAWNNVPLDLASMAVPVASAIPMFDGARWAASIGDITRSGLGANVVSAWKGRPLDPITMGAPNPGDVPEWDGAKWISTPASGVVLLGGDVTGPAGANTVVRWENQPLDPVTMGAPAVGNVPTWDGAKWVAAPGGGAVVLAGDVTGPSGANTVVAWENIPLDPVTMGAPAANSIPQLIGGQWHAVATGTLAIAGDVIGTLAASKVVAWENVPLDPASMGAPAVNSIPEFIGGQWRAVLASGLTIAGDVTGTLAASKVVAWENQPLDPATMGAPAVGNVPTWDGAKWIAAPGGGAVVLGGDVTGPSGANTVVKWENRPLDPVTMGAPADGSIPIYDLGLNLWRAVLIGTDASLTNAGSLIVKGWEAIPLDATMAAPAVGNVPVFNVDGTWHAGPPGGAVVLAGDVTGPSGANTVVKWLNLPLDPVTMAAPVAGDVPQWDGAKWIAVGLSALGIAGDVTGTLAASKVVKWDNVPLLTGAGAGSFDIGSLPDAAVPIWDVGTGQWRAFALSGGATMNNGGLVTISPAGITLTGNVNGPANANRFLALTLTSVDANIAVVETSGWTNVRMRTLTADRTVLLPPVPQNGEVVVVKDATGSLASFAIIVDGGANNIDEVAGPYTMTGQQNGIKGAATFTFFTAAPAGWYIS